MNYKTGGSHWVIDSGCTQHMTGDPRMFTSLDEEVDGQERITFGDNSKGKVKGLGKVSISNDHSISNVLYVASLSFNLLSVGQLCDRKGRPVLSVGQLSSDTLASNACSSKRKLLYLRRMMIK